MCVPAVDHHRDIALRGTLGDGAHVDSCFAQRRKHLGGDPGRAGHAVADDSENGEAAIDLDALDLPLAQLAVERTAHHASARVGLPLRNREADRVLGAALRNQDHRDALFPQRAEQSMRRAGHADHAGAFEVEQRDGVDAGDALDRSTDCGSAQISVPARSGAKVLRIQIGILRSTAGAMVCGWMTLAPK